MLDNARSIHPIDIRQCRRLGLFVNPQMNKPDIIIEAPAQDLEIGKRNDTVYVGLVGGTSLAIEGVVLDEVDVNVGFEGFGAVLFGVERIFECFEDLTLACFVGWAAGAVGLCAGFEGVDCRERVCRGSEEKGEGG